MHLAALALGTLILNIPFGWWRSGTRKYGAAWFAMIHLPIPLVVLSRVWLGFGFGAAPLLVAASVAGQILGGRLRQVRLGS
jgi:hypothetical protein